MDTESLVQPERQLTFSDTAEELLGHLEVPDRPELTAGYAEIYHGVWTSPNGERVDVAVKEFKTLIPRNRQSDLNELQTRTDTRIKREVFVWSHTKHPNLHPLLGYRSRPHPRLISPWCHHGNLADYLRDNPDLSRLEKLRLIYQVALGLNHLHSLLPPICHADIKPENVLINARFEAALSDFGLSRVLQSLGGSSGLTTSERAKGTLNYMARELFTDEKRRPDRESDIYAFGGLILTVMSGKCPFSGLWEPAILFRVVQNQQPRPEDHLNLSRTDPLWSLMRRCWNESPPARPSIREILPELWRYICYERSNPGLSPSLASGDDCKWGHPVSEDDPSTANFRGENRALHGPNHSPSHGELSGLTAAEATGNSTARRVLPRALKIFKRIEIGSKVVPGIGKYIGAVAEVGLILAEIVETIGENQATARGLASAVSNLAGFLDRETLVKESSRNRDDEISTCFTNIQMELRSVQGKIEILDHVWPLSSDLSLRDHEIRVKKWQSLIRKGWEATHFLATLNTTSFISELDKEVQKEQRRLLNRLGDGKYGAEGNAIEDVMCFPGTRVELLERIDNWIRDTSATNKVLWIRGMAGRGKSTVASTVVFNWRCRAACAIFHFRRGQNILNTRVVSALSRQLGVCLIPEVKNAVLDSVRENEDVADQRLDEQFKTLFVASLAKLSDQPHPILLVVDALDECDNFNDAVDFLKLIDRYSASLPSSIKILLTSRPEGPLLRALEPKQWRMEDLDSAPDVLNDISQFIKQACTQVREDHRLPSNWPSSQDTRRLVEMSQGLFQWARTAITYVSKGSPMDRMRLLMQRPGTWSGLDDLYNQIISKAFDNAKMEPERELILCSVLGAIVVAPCPVSLEVIAALYKGTELLSGMEQPDIVEFLRRDVLVDLNSLLFIPTSPTEPMRLLHSSIYDLLVNKQRCQQRPYHVDIVQQHQRLAKLCLSNMLQEFKENLRSLSHLSMVEPKVQITAGNGVSGAVRYCCQAWSVHLMEGVQWSKSGPNATGTILADFELFSKEKILRWIEVMGQLGATAEAIIIARNVHQWLFRCPRGIPASSLTTLWHDVQRFVVAFLEPISSGALHIYASALPHCPRATTIWEQYHDHAKVQTLRGLQPLSWPSNLWTRHVGDELFTIAFSPDGLRLATGSKDGAVRLWDVQTGMLLGKPLTGHHGPVRSVAFSPDGKMLASGADDRTIRLWDPETGTLAGEPWIAHSDRVWSIAFSPDSKVLASGSADQTARLWNVQTGQPLGEPLAGHHGSVRSIAFSPSGKVLATGSEDGTILSWNVRNGTLLTEPSARDNDWVSSIAFSPDGMIVASGSGDGTVQLWDAQTATPLREPLKGHSEWISSVAFSTDGNTLASGSGDYTIRLWDVRSGTPLGAPLTGHRDWVRSVAFSPDNTALVSGSEDGTIRLWDIQYATHCNETWTGFSNSQVLSVAFSPGGKLLASGSSDGTIQFWDTRTGAPLGEPLIGHTDWVRSVAFSSDGAVVASGSDDGTVRLWDVQAGTPCVTPLTGHGDWVRSVTFSPNGTVVASGSDDGTIRLWDTHSGTPLAEPLVGHSDWVISVAFSVDGEVIVGRYDDGHLFAWKASTLQPCEAPANLPRPASLTFEDHWLTLSSSRIFWLPSQYWDIENHAVIFSNGRVAVASAEGLFIFDVSRLITI